MSSVLFELRESVAVITLNRPQKFNAFNREMALLLQEKLDACTSNDVRCVLLTATGKAFSSGQDLSEATNGQGLDIRAVLAEQYEPIVTKIRALEKPVVAAVNGVAAGAGANIALCCDIVVAAQQAVFVQAFSKVGLIPDCGGTYFLPRLVGWQKAAALTMLGDAISAEEAERMNLIYKWLPDADFATQSFSIAHALAQKPTRALALTKQALAQSAQNTLEAQLKAEARLQQEAGNTADFAEGVQAFLQKRVPNFTGR